MTWTLKQQRESTRLWKFIFILKSFSHGRIALNAWTMYLFIQHRTKLTRSIRPADSVVREAFFIRFFVFIPSIATLTTFYLNYQMLSFVDEVVVSWREVGWGYWTRWRVSNDLLNFWLRGTVCVRYTVDGEGMNDEKGKWRVESCREQRGNITLEWQSSRYFSIIFSISKWNSVENPFSSSSLLHDVWASIEKNCGEKAHMSLYN